jgi:hypothetical protein
MLIGPQGGWKASAGYSSPTSVASIATLHHEIHQYLLETNVAKESISWRSLPHTNQAWWWVREGNIKPYWCSNDGQIIFPERCDLQLLKPVKEVTTTPFLTIMAPLQEVDPNKRVFTAVSPPKKRGGPPTLLKNRRPKGTKPHIRKENSYSKGKIEEVMIWMIHHRVRYHEEIRPSNSAEAESYFQIPASTTRQWKKKYRYRHQRDNETSIEMHVNIIRLSLIAQ